MLVQLNHDQKPINADLVYLNRDDKFVFDDELSQIEKSHKDFHIHKVIDRRLDKSDFESYLKDKSTIFYLSGPEPMVESYEGVLNHLGADEEHLKTDFFPGY
jgi:ferredoxin-NADP reductase